MGSSSSRTCACCPRTPDSASTTSATSSTPLRWLVRSGSPGVTCPRTSRPGRWSTSRPAAGSPPAASRRSSTTSGPCSDSPTAGTPSRRPPSSTAARSSPPPRAAGGPATTAPSGRRARRCTPRSTPLGHLLALHVTPADEQDRDQVARARRGRAGGDRGVGRTGVRRPGLHRARTRRSSRPSDGIDLEVVKLPEAKRGFVLLPRRWVVERSFGWTARFRRLARDYERLVRDARRPALRRLQLPDAPQGRSAVRVEFITRSK